MPTKLPSHLVHAGHVVQVARATLDTYTSFTHDMTSFTTSDTVPTDSNGVLLVTVTMTPKSATNLLLIRGHVNGQITTGNTAYVFVTRNSGSAVAVTTDHLANYFSIHLFGNVVAGSTTQTTFKLRMGHTSGFIHVNGSSGSGTRVGGGNQKTSLEIVEVSA